MYTVNKVGRYWQVVNTVTGGILSCHADRFKALTLVHTMNALIRKAKHDLSK